MSTIAANHESLSPPLKWAGGKRWLVPILQKIWQPYADRRLVEPFVGGMAIALGLQPQRAVLNDCNAHLINFYRCLQEGLYIDILLENNSEYYYQCRDRFNQLIAEGKAESPESAKLFYFMNRTGYNGLCRFSSRNRFNVPFGRYKKINYVQDLTRYAGALKNWQFTATDFAEIPIAPDDFIYADPPYDVVFTKYSAHDFKWEDQIRLAEWLAAHPGPAVISNQATERILALYEKLGFSLSFHSAPRRISCTGDRRPAQEVLAHKGI